MIRLKTIVYLALTLLFAVSAVITGRHGCYYSTSPAAKEHIESILHQRQLQADRLFDEIEPYLSINSFDNMPQSFFSIVDHYATRYQTYLAMYKNWQLRLWPARSVVVPDVFDPNLFAQNVVLLGHSYYLSSIKRINNVDVVVLSLIKTQYKTPNDYFTNRFASEFNVSGDTEIVINPLVESRIYDMNNSYAFSVSQKGVSQLSVFWFSIALLLLLLSVIAFFRLLYFVMKILSDKIGLVPTLLVSFIAALAARMLLVGVNLPQLLCINKVFNPEEFSSSPLFISLGDSMLNAIWILFFVFTVYMWISKHKYSLSKSHATATLVFLGVLGLIAVALYIEVYIRAVIKDSIIELELYKVLNINIYTVIALLILLFLVCSYMLLTHLYIRLLKTTYPLKRIVIIYFFVLAVLTPFLFFLNNIKPWAVIFYHLISGLLYLFQAKKLRGHSLVALSTLLLSGHFVIQAHDYYIQKWYEARKVTALKMAFPGDMSAELKLIDISNRMTVDTVMRNIISTSEDDLQKVTGYVRDRYFKDLSRSYNINVHCYKQGDSIYVDSSSRQWQSWRDYYNTRISMSGTMIPNSDYYRLNITAGTTRYIGIHRVFNMLHHSPTIIVELEDIFNNLFRGEVQNSFFYDRYLQNHDVNDLSYAFYCNNKIVHKAGAFDYWAQLDNTINDGTTFRAKYIDRHKHLIFNISDNKQIIISESNATIYNLAIWFSYTFIFYYITVLFIVFVFRLPFAQAPFKRTIQNRIQITMALAMFVSIFAIGAGSFYFNFQISHRKYNEVINDKIKSITNEITFDISKVNDIRSYDDGYINHLMIKYSAIFDIDVSLFDNSGNLIASSRNDFYDRQIISRKMNYEAFRSLTVENSNKVVTAENIGELSYYSAYIPLVNNVGVVLGFLNLPFLGHDHIQTKELTSMVVALLNIYVLLILLSLILTVFISSKVTQPLLIIREKLKDFDIKKHNKPIDYESEDEIGALVSEYNRMASELSKNTALLAQSERESAWQSMARQIAHEIKNPLTPMKLNVQLLQRAWEDKAYDFDKRLEKVCKTLIEQIDALSNIATEFSTFSKTPTVQLEDVDVYNAVVSCVNLFEDTKNVKILVDSADTSDMKIFADRDQLIRVFTNLIKNAIQAIPEERFGLIRIKLKVNKSFVTISVSDNGTGIPLDMQSRMFQPNFTTKTSGMGLGLAMVRNIVTSIDGTIWYETQENEGTTFFIQIPLALSSRHRGDRR